MKKFLIEKGVIEIRKVVISWILVVLWAGAIFFMSNMDTNESNDKSKKTINEIIEKAVETTNNWGITDKHPSNNKMKQVIDKLNKPLRKVAHASEYLILTILLIVALTNSGINGKKTFIIAILICFLYACTDEYHQTFIKGRTGQFTDTLIDTLGGIVGCSIFILKNKIIMRRKVS